jgi:hypothetical protein
MGSGMATGTPPLPLSANGTVVTDSSGRDGNAAASMALGPFRNAADEMGA